MQILIDLPDEEARVAMFEKYLPQENFDGKGNLLVDRLDYKKLAKMSEGTKYFVVVT
jgi:SpoVK/Ycf46/Vps4 family AAA+-type ATPase